MHAAVHLIATVKIIQHLSTICVSLKFKFTFIYRIFFWPSLPSVYFYLSENMRLQCSKFCLLKSKVMWLLCMCVRSRRKTKGRLFRVDREVYESLEDWK